MHSLTEFSLHVAT